MSTTANLGLTKPTVGGSDSTWGNTLNSNFDLLDTAVNKAMPTGGIIMWSGTIATIPTGWALCDGTNGTPNLTGKFIVHADSDSSGTYAVGATGGANDVTLATSELPAHSHTGTAASGGAHTHTGTTNSAGAHTHTYTDSYVLAALSAPGIDIDYNANTYNPNGLQTGTTSSAGSHSHTVTIASGGAHTHTLSVDNARRWWRTRKQTALLCTCLYYENVNMTLVPLDIPSGFYRIGTDYEQSGRWREGSLVRWLDGSLRPIGGWQNRKEDFALQPIRGMHAWEALNQSTWLAGGSHNSLVAMTGGGLCYDITPDNLATGRIDAAVSAGFGKGAYGVGFWGTPRQQLSNAIPEPATFWTLDNFGELMVGCHYDDGRLVEWDLNIVSGSELITNNSFSAGTDWTLGTGWAISGGEAKWTGTTAANLEQAITGLTSGKKYHFTINVTDPDADADATTIPSLKVKIIGTTTTTVLLDKTLPIGNSFYRFDTDDTGVTIQIYPATNAEQNVNVTETSLKLAVVATPITNAPLSNLGLVVTEERFIFALGSGGNSRKISWCDREDRKPMDACGNKRGRRYRVANRRADYASGQN